MTNVGAGEKNRDSSGKFLWSASQKLFEFLLTTSVFIPPSSTSELHDEEARPTVLFSGNSTSNRLSSSSTTTIFDEIMTRSSAAQQQLQKENSYNKLQITTNIPSQQCSAPAPQQGLAGYKILELGAGSGWLSSQVTQEILRRGRGRYSSSGGPVYYLATGTEQHGHATERLGDSVAELLRARKQQQQLRTTRKVVPDEEDDVSRSGTSCEKSSAFNDHSSDFLIPEILHTHQRDELNLNSNYNSFTFSEAGSYKLLNHMATNSSTGAENEMLPELEPKTPRVDDKHGGNTEVNAFLHLITGPLDWTFEDVSVAGGPYDIFDSTHFGLVLGADLVYNEVGSEYLPKVLKRILLQRVLNSTPAPPFGSRATRVFYAQPFPRFQKTSTAAAAAARTGEPQDEEVHLGDGDAAEAELKTRRPRIASSNGSSMDSEVLEWVNQDFERIFADFVENLWRTGLGLEEFVGGARKCNNTMRVQRVAREVQVRERGGSPWMRYACEEAISSAKKESQSSESSLWRTRTRRLLAILRLDSKMSCGVCESSSGWIEEKDCYLLNLLHSNKGCRTRLTVS